PQAHSAQPAPAGAIQPGQKQDDGRQGHQPFPPAAAGAPGRLRGILVTTHRNGVRDLSPLSSPVSTKGLPFAGFPEDSGRGGSASGNASSIPRAYPQRNDVSLSGGCLTKGDRLDQGAHTGPCMMHVRAWNRFQKRPENPCSPTKTTWPTCSL